MRSDAAGLVLAAGAGRRFRGATPKLLAVLGGRPLLEHAVSAFCEVAELQRVIVVLGADAGAILEAVDFGRAETVVCADWEQGLSASLRCGLEALPEAGRIAVTLGDIPTVTPEVMRRLLDAPDGSRATYRGRPGHPVVLGPAQLARAAELSGDRGARALLEGELEVECGDLACGRDVDTLEDLDTLRQGRERCQPL